jgi:hypothetical protein
MTTPKELMEMAREVDEAGFVNANRALRSYAELLAALEYISRTVGTLLLEDDAMSPEGIIAYAKALGWPGLEGT